MKKDKILEAYEDLLTELYTVAGRSTGRSRSGSKGQRASNVALVCPQCGDLDDHSHEGLESGAKCPVCGQIVEERIDERLPSRAALGAGKKAKKWEEIRDKRYRASLVTTVVLKGRDFADVEWQILNAFEKKKPKVKGMTIESFSVDGIDEL